MKKILMIALIALSTQQLLAAEVVEAIVARVGDRIVTRTQYVNRLREGLEEIDHQNVPDAAARKEALRKSLINDLLSELLIKDRADRLGLTISSTELEDAVKRLKTQYGMESDKDFEDSLRKAGMSRSVMEARLRDTLLTQKVFSRELRSREELTDKELRERYEREKDSYRLPDRARVHEIIILKPIGAADLSPLRTRAEAAAIRARTGEDFTKLVTEFSEAPTKGKKGDLGVVGKGELLPELDSAIFQSKAGAVLGPFETKFGFHVLLVDDRLPSEVPGFDTVKDRLRKEASEQTFQRDYQVYIENLRKDAYVQINEANIPKV
ncbi:MAG TPA: peptidyl-prolyl cis-trans isomerase [Thermoanaerobaculia bacterium]|nr:peptidyl-prolyl cis-trans isomerase [Thermoanaerobaculia bacterium]